MLDRLAFLWMILGCCLLRGVAAEPLPESLAYVLQAEQLADTKSKALAVLTACERDWIVLDAGFDTTDDSRWSAAELTRIRHGRPGRKILAYLSVGEAEKYRPYWKASWNNRPPAFLMAENRHWPGNYQVKFWLDSWQAIILPEVDRLMQQGFDGIYLDKVDIYENFEYDSKSEDWIDNRPNRATGRTYRADMVDWVSRIAARARKTNRNALIIPQNAAPLLDVPKYRHLISGIGIEDLWTDGRRPKPQDEIRSREAHLQPLATLRKPILCIDYSAAPKLRQQVAKRAMQRGYCLLITDRALSSIGKSLEDFGYLGPGYGNATKRFTAPRDMKEHDWSNPEEIARTWDAALVRIPTDDKGKVVRSTMRTLSKPNRAPRCRWPTVIYLHGCSGVWAGTYRRIDFLAAHGFAVIAPVSLARRKYPQSCDVAQHRGGLYRPTLRMRQFDAENAIIRAKRLDWVDSDNLFLMGLSQGAITTATFRSEDPAARVNARVLEGWTCHAGWKEYCGINAPRSEPVLALVAKYDPWFQNEWSRGDCRPFLDPNNGSRSIVFGEGRLSKRHELLEDKHVQRLVIKFLQQHVKQ